MNNKKLYLKYLKEFLLEKGDYRYDRKLEKIINSEFSMEKAYDMDRLHSIISESFKDLLSFKSYVREHRINDIIS